MDVQAVLRAISAGAIPVVLAVTLHEVAHGRAARALGDPTAESLGRLSLNPLKHVDPFGTVLLPAFLYFIGSPFLFGWAKPVPIDPRNFKHPRRGMALVALAGPASNLAMAIGWALIFVLARRGLFGVGGGGEWLSTMGEIGLLFNVLLAIVNLVPIPPLDGGRVLVGVLPLNAARAVARIEPFGLWIAIGALLLANSRGYSLGPVAERISGLIAQVFS